MKIQINNIDRLKSENGLTDVCKTIHYTMIVSKTIGKYEDVVTYDVSAIGTVGLDSPDSNNYIKYNDLTEENIKDWVKYSLGEEKMANIETSLLNQVEEKISPNKLIGLPWND
jgi:hypothetical protein